MRKSGKIKHVAKPKAYVIGVGPGSPEYLTDRARNAIRSAEVVLGWELDLLPIKRMLNDKEVHLQNVSNYTDVAKRVAKLALKARKTVAVLRVGDPCISSGLASLLQTFSRFDVEIISGISSTQVAASIARINLDDSVVISFHDYGDHEREKKFMVDVFRAGRHLIILTSPDVSPGEAARFLISNGLDASISAVVCSNLSLKDEEIDCTTLEGVSEGKYHWLSLLTVINPSVPTNEEAHSIWKKWRATRSSQAFLS